MSIFSVSLQTLSKAMFEGARRCVGAAGTFLGVNIGDDSYMLAQSSNKLISNSCFSVKECIIKLRKKVCDVFTLQGNDAKSLFLDANVKRIDDNLYTIVSDDNKHYGGNYSVVSYGSKSIMFDPKCINASVIKSASDNIFAHIAKKCKIFNIKKGLESFFNSKIETDIIEVSNAISNITSNFSEYLIPANTTVNNNSTIIVNNNSVDEGNDVYEYFIREGWVVAIGLLALGSAAVNTYCIWKKCTKSTSDEQGIAMTVIPCSGEEDKEFNSKQPDVITTFPTISWDKTEEPGLGGSNVANSSNGYYMCMNGKAKDDEGDSAYGGSDQAYNHDEVDTSGYLLPKPLIDEGSSNKGRKSLNHVYEEIGESTRGDDYGIFAATHNSESYYQVPTLPLRAVKETKVDVVGDKGFCDIEVDQV